jgi:hypothetical protein
MRTSTTQGARLTRELQSRLPFARGNDRRPQARRRPRLDQPHLVRHSIAYGDLQNAGDARSLAALTGKTRRKPNL